MKVKREERSNTFCGPAALSLITGKHVDECVKEVHAYRNLCKDPDCCDPALRSVRGMSNTEMLRVLLNMKHQNTPVSSLFGYDTSSLKENPTLVTFMRWLKRQGRWDAKKVYLLNTTGHYVVMKGIKLFDNRNPEGVFFGKYNRRRVRVKYAWEVRKASCPVPSGSCR
jgi:hypothetical protein